MKTMLMNRMPRSSLKVISNRFKMRQKSKKSKKYKKRKETIRWRWRKK